MNVSRFLGALAGIGIAALLCPVILRVMSGPLDRWDWRFVLVMPLSLAALAFGWSWRV